MLNTWFGNEYQEWQLLYKASKDGFSAVAFHTKCDGHSPTFTVVLVSKYKINPLTPKISLPNDSHYVSLENLVSDQLVIP